MPFHPKQFVVNDCWLAYKLTRNPVSVESGLAHIFIVQDAASMFIFGNAFAPADEEAPTRGDAALLLRQAWETKREWPKKLVLPEPVSAENGFAEAARWNGLVVESVSESQITLYIEDAQVAYEEFLSRGAKGDA